MDDLEERGRMDPLDRYVCMMSSNENISALLVLSARNSPVSGDAELWCFLLAAPEQTFE